GKPGAVKAACPVWRGADGKGPCKRDLAGGLPYGRSTGSRRSSARCTTELLSTYQHDTPATHQEADTPTTVEVVDPMHPPYGRRFPLLHRSTTLTGPGFVWVAYRDFMQLRLPLSATNLVPACLDVRTLFTEQALTELLALADAWGVWEAGNEVCRRPHATSG